MTFLYLLRAKIARRQSNHYDSCRNIHTRDKILPRHWLKA